MAASLLLVVLVIAPLLVVAVLLVVLAVLAVRMVRSRRNLVGHVVEFEPTCSDGEVQRWLKQPPDEFADSGTELMLQRYRMQRRYVFVLLGVVIAILVCELGVIGIGYMLFAMQL